MSTRNSMVQRAILELQLPPSELTEPEREQLLTTMHETENEILMNTCAITEEFEIPAWSDSNISESSRRRIELPERVMTVERLYINDSEDLTAMRLDPKEINTLEAP